MCTYDIPAGDRVSEMCVCGGGGYTIHDIVAALVKFQWFHCTDCFQSYIQYIQPYISISIVFLLKRLHFNCFCVSCGVQVAHASVILLKSLANAPLAMYGSLQLQYMGRLHSGRQLMTANPIDITTAPLGLL